MSRARCYQYTVLVGDSASIARLESSGEECLNVELVDSLEAALEIRDTSNEDVRIIVDPIFLENSGIALIHPQHPSQDVEEMFSKAFRLSPQIMVISRLEDGRYIDVNDTFLEFMEYSREEVIGRTSTELGIWTDRDGRPKLAAMLVEHGMIRNVETRFRTKSGKVLTTLFSADIIELRGEKCLLAIVNDITDLKRVEEELHRNNIRLELVSDAASELLASDAPEAAILRLAERAMGYLDCQVFFNYLVDEYANGLRLNICSGVSSEDCEKFGWLDFGSAVCGCIERRCTSAVVEDVQNSTLPEACLVRSLGVSAYACMPLRSHKDRLMGTFSFGSRSKTSFTEDDLSVMHILADNVAIALERKLAEQELRDGRERLRLATEAGQVGTWSLDVATGVAMWDEYLRRVCNVPPDAVVTVDTFRKLLHPEDRDRAIQALERAIECGTEYSDEFRIVRTDGSIRWAASRGRVVCDDSGRPIRLIGAATDTTQRKNAEEELARARKEAERRAGEIESLVANMPDGLSIVDAKGRLVFMNDEGKRILGLEPGEELSYGPGAFQPKTLEDIPIGLDQTATMRALRGEVVRDVRYKLCHRDREVIISISASPVRDSNGAIIGATNTFRDSAARVEFEQQREEFLRREHNIANVLQQALIPAEVPVRIDGYRIAVRYQPALREAEIGGDFYDVFEMDNGKIGVLIGDVVGKGLTAAIRVAAARYTIKGYAYLDPSPSRILALANDSLYRESLADESGMLTAFLGVLDIATGIMTYSNAGHEPPVILGNDGQTTELKSGGIPLGVIDGFGFCDVECELKIGEKIVMVTDGITEARTDTAILFEKDGLLGCLASNYAVPPEELAQRILDTAKVHAGGQLQDDAAIVIIERMEH